jgi:thiol-disulfide isomerase/thioredoxin
MMSAVALTAGGCSPKTQPVEGAGSAAGSTLPATSAVGPAEPTAPTPLPEEAALADGAEPTLLPSPAVRPAEHETTDWKEIPRFAANSPFDADYQAPVVQEGKRLWARSFRWERAPELVVEKWLGEQPRIEGKYVLIEFWATWCGPCRRSIPLLNGFHQKYGDELTVIGISDETEEQVLAMEQPKIEFYRAIDTQARMKDALGVFGIPHAILLEPEGYVIWEGFPLLEGHRLTDEVIEKILEVGRKQKAPGTVGP